MTNTEALERFDRAIVEIDAVSAGILSRDHADLTAAFLVEQARARAMMARNRLRFLQAIEIVPSPPAAS